MAQAVECLAVLLEDSLVLAPVRVPPKRKVLQLRKLIRLACKGRTKHKIH